MNFFSKLFGSEQNSGQEAPVFPWNALTAIDQLDGLIEASKTNTVVIFKHSTRCGISAMTLRRFEEDYNQDLSDIELYFLDLIRFRDVSNAIAAKFGVQHQSPQMIVIKNGQVVHHASHYDIQAQALITLS